MWHESLPVWNPPASDACALRAEAGPAQFRYASLFRFARPTQTGTIGQWPGENRRRLPTLWHTVSCLYTRGPYTDHSYFVRRPELADQPHESLKRHIGLALLTPQETLHSGAGATRQTWLNHNSRCVLVLWLLADRVAAQAAPCSFRFYGAAATVRRQAESLLLRDAPRTTGCAAGARAVVRLHRGR